MDREQDSGCTDSALDQYPQRTIKPGAAQAAADGRCGLEPDMVGGAPELRDSERAVEAGDAEQDMAWITSVVEGLSSHRNFARFADLMDSLLRREGVSSARSFLEGAKDVWLPQLVHAPSASADEMVLPSSGCSAAAEELVAPAGGTHVHHLRQQQQHLPQQVASEQWRGRCMMLRHKFSSLAGKWQKQSQYVTPFTMAVLAAVSPGFAARLAQRLAQRLPQQLPQVQQQQQQQQQAAQMPQQLTQEQWQQRFEQWRQHFLSVLQQQEVEGEAAEQQAMQMAQQHIAGEMQQMQQEIMVAQQLSQAAVVLPRVQQVSQQQQLQERSGTAAPTGSGTSSIM